MMYHRKTSIEEFLSATAAKQPTPGGGSVAALAGALSSAIGQMVLSYSIGRKDLKPFETALERAIHQYETLRELMLELMVEDQDAYASWSALRKLPVDSMERQVGMPEVVLACVRVPQTVTATAVKILSLCEIVVPIVNPWLLSDLAVCAELAMATARSANYNVRVNLSSIEDSTDRKRLEEESNRMLSHATKLIQEVVPSIWARHAEANKTS